MGTVTSRKKSRGSLTPASSRRELGILFDTYRERDDLIRAFPEVVRGDIRGLLTWVVTHGITIDQAKPVLAPYTTQYQELLSELQGRYASSPGCVTDTRRGQIPVTPSEQEGRLESYRKLWQPGYTSTSNEELWQRRAQPDFLKKQGLKPNDMFLDLGCGYLRGTIGLLDYLEDGHFFGIDISETNIDRARARASELARHKPNLAAAGRFEIDQIWPKARFDIVLAASLLTHLWPADMKECLRQVSSVLRGKFFTTIFKDNTVDVFDGWCGSCFDHRDDHIVGLTVREQNVASLNFCYNTVWLEQVSRECGLEMKEVGLTEIGQYMLELFPSLSRNPS